MCVCVHMRMPVWERRERARRIWINTYMYVHGDPTNALQIKAYRNQQVSNSLKAKKLYEIKLCGAFLSSIVHTQQGEGKVLRQIECNEVCIV